MNEFDAKRLPIDAANVSRAASSMSNSGSIEVLSVRLPHFSSFGARVEGASRDASQRYEREMIPPCPMLDNHLKYGRAP